MNIISKADRPKRDTVFLILSSQVRVTNETQARSDARNSSNPRKSIVADRKTWLWKICICDSPVSSTLNNLTIPSSERILSFKGHRKGFLASTYHLAQQVPWVHSEWISKLVTHEHCRAAVAVRNPQRQSDSTASHGASSQHA